jgi:hypothetical protein
MIISRKCAHSRAGSFRKLKANAGMRGAGYDTRAGATQLPRFPISDSGRYVRDNHYNRRRSDDVDKVIWVDPTGVLYAGNRR